MPKQKLVLKTYDEINKDRKHMRKILLLISIPFIIIISLLLVKTTSMYILAGQTISLYEQKEYEEANIKATEQKSVNLLEEWLAYYNAGVSLSAQDKFPEAIEEYKKAKTLVGNKIPALCYIDANLALSYEKNGDLLTERGNKIEAEKNYLLAIELSENALPECSTPQSGGTGESLEETGNSSSGKVEALSENEEDTSTGNPSNPQENTSPSGEGREQIQEQLDQSDSDRKTDEQTEGNEGKEPASKPW